MNKIILMGRLTRDPEVRYGGADNQTAIGRFSLAVDRRFRRAGDSVEADFFNCTAFGRQAEFAEKYLKQGTKILLVGRVQNDNYTNREGQKVYSVQIIAEEIEFAERNNRPQAQPAPAADNFGGAAADDGFMNIPDGVDDDDLPFN